MGWTSRIPDFRSVLAPCPRSEHPADGARMVPSAHLSRFEADQTADGTHVVIDTRHFTCEVVVGCSSAAQAERIARSLNHEFPSEAARDRRADLLLDAQRETDDEGSRS